MGRRWRFAEPGTTGVYSTRQVLDEGALLAIVAHDTDGDWQFLHEESDDAPEARDEDDLVLVHLQEIDDRFPEVAELADLPRGWYAWREEQGQAWVREPQPAEWSSG
ncbi:MAG TPA: hypothetical protein VG265_02475 [Gaiellaceae bacterium]|jgi:hypothetical protein|nr:hypothetical protein [Gaiellaceae bacterium]